MDLLKKINEDLKSALKSGDHFRLGVLRMVNSALKNKAIEKGKDAKLTDEEILQVFTKEAKKRKESVIAFETGGRPELAEGEKKELAIIEEYLPKQMSREEVKKEVERILATIADKSKFGLVMKEVMKDLGGKADAKLISEIIKEKLG
jgi:uncharacterized protein YqeY